MNALPSHIPPNSPRIIPTFEPPFGEKFKTFVAFYEEKQKVQIDRYREVSLKDIWNFSFIDKEGIHSYIQWLFPTDMPSQFNPDGPCFSAEEFETLKQNLTIIANLRTSFNIMLEFYGLTYHNANGGMVIPSDSFSLDAPWLRLGDHNQSRISRILRSLHLFGLQEEADAFYYFLVTLKDRSSLQSSTFDYWFNNLHGQTPE